MKAEEKGPLKDKIQSAGKKKGNMNFLFPAQSSLLGRGEKMGGE